MNLKMSGLIATVALAAYGFAQEAAPAAPVAATPAVETAAPAPETAAAVAEPAPVAVRGAEDASSAEPVEAAAAPATVEAAPAAAQAAEPVAEENAPVAVRGAESASSAAPAADVAAAPAESAPAPDASVEAASAETAPVAAEDEMAAPKAVRGADASGASDASGRTVYYESVYAGENGSPVRVLYVSRSAEKDSVTMDELMGLKPMKFKIGAQGFIGSYYMSNSEWNGEEFDGMSWRAGLMAILPLNKYTMGVKLGVLYEQSEASETYDVNDVATGFKFCQKKLDVPVLFTFKSPNSRFYFDLGAQLSIPLQDELKISYTDSGKSVKNKVDLIDKDFRNNLDWGFVFGFSVMANDYVSLDIRADVGLSNMYEGRLGPLDLDLSSSTFGVGLTVYPF